MDGPWAFGPSTKISRAPNKPGAVAPSGVQGQYPGGGGGGGGGGG